MKIKSTTLIAFTTTVILFLWAIYVVPPLQDEFTQYHRLACWSFENSKFNTFVYGCDAHETDLLGIKFHRSYLYIGIASSLIYLPFYYLLPSVLSHYLYGILFLVLFSCLLSKAFGLSLKYSFIPLLYFPLTFMMIHDAGPIRLAIIAYPLLMLSIIAIYRQNYSLIIKVLITFFTALVITVAVEDKPFFIYLLAPAALLAVAAMVNSHQTKLANVSAISQALSSGVIKNNTQAHYISVLLVVFIGLGVLLILFGNLIGEPYLFYLYRWAKLFIKIGFFEELNHMHQYLTNPTIYSSRIYHVTTDYSSLKTIIPVACFLPILFLIVRKIFWGRSLVIILACLSFHFLVIEFLIVRNVYPSHHFVFLHLPLIIILMLFAAESTTKFRLVIFILCLNVFVSIGFITSARIFLHSSPSREIIFEYLDKNAENSVINTSKWGAYYIKSLYGSKEQIVTCTEPPGPHYNSKFKDVLNQTKRSRILNICYECNLQQIEQSFPDARVSEVYLDTADWKIFEITY